MTKKAVIITKLINDKKAVATLRICKCKSTLVEPHPLAEAVPSLWLPVHNVKSDQKEARLLQVRLLFFPCKRHYAPQHSGEEQFMKWIKVLSCRY